MKRQQGFTLVELLVVIAIISILAAIAIPAVGGFISRSQMRGGEATITSIETAMTGILSDATTRDFRGIFTTEFLRAMAADFSVADLSQFEQATEIYSEVLYKLLRQGRNADLTPISNSELDLFLDSHNNLDANSIVRTSVKQKLSATYIDLQTDPWGNEFLFFIGPLPRSVNMPLRSYRQDFTNPEQDGLRIPVVYNQAAKNWLEENTVPGQPAPDNGVGIPADNNLAFYIWSPGEDAFSNQGYKTTVDSEKDGGGDDVSSWDMGNGQKGWEVWY